MSGGRFVQVLWLFLAICGALLWLSGPVSQVVRIQHLCDPPKSCAVYQLDRAGAQPLLSHSLSLTAYAAFTIVLLGLLSVIWYGLAGVIIWRQPSDRGAALSAFFLILFPMFEVATWIPSAPKLVQQALPAAGITVLVLFCILFPDGAFAPGWTVWLIPLAVLAGISSQLPVPVRAVVFVAVLVTVVTAQVSRFRSLSSWADRQKTKWALFGVGVAMAGFACLALGFVLLPHAQTSPGGLFTSFANSTGLAIASSAVPITIGIAVLRYHLWDINRAVSLALVYVSLTVILVGVYIGGVIGLEAIFQVVTGNGSNIAIAISTLAIAVLFGPLRQRLQSTIDRRFYRGRYDAALALAAFSERLRQDVDLEHIRQDMTTLLQETLQPEHVSVWLTDE